MIKKSIIKVAKNLIKSGHRDELFGLLKICKEQGLDISKDIDYDYKKKYEGSKAFIVTFKIKQYKTEDKYVKNQTRCYIEVDNMVSEGIETMLTVQADDNNLDSFSEKILDSLKEMKTELLREIVQDCLDEDIDPKKMLSDFKLLYHYADEETSDFLNDKKQEIESALSKEEFLKMQEQVIEEYEEFAKLEQELEGEELD